MREEVGVDHVAYDKGQPRRRVAEGEAVGVHGAQLACTMHALVLADIDHHAHHTAQVDEVEAPMHDVIGREPVQLRLQHMPRPPEYRVEDETVHN